MKSIKVDNQSAAYTKAQSGNNVGSRISSNTLIQSTIFSMIMFVVGMIAGMYINLTSVSKKESAPDLKNHEPGNFIILKNGTSSITFEGFKGQITWYRIHEFEIPDPFYANNHFQPIQTVEIIEKQPIQVPNDVYAVLVSGTSNGKNYDMIIKTH
jgi:preprotein translocase subunit SecG